ncbi:hypothetical protein IP98_02908 [Flavobacterium cauense R2A-7]|uniref:Uncharacterized protein n=1 Tax=Flavobacterium cauense R2A-7 TaxID=1341154 RepID=A0A562LKC4_9FLAO|nr:hypothetical protein Q762_14900 [Flavobacterium cauense R2A-7]TWI08043.1 hypothetical protein IP98_02908 [Flavobacterium cauense R2A-7]
MPLKYSNFYWFFIILLQTFLIIEKVIYTQTILNDKFYLWNIIVIICGIVFLYNRLKLNKILLNPEKIIILMIVLNGISTIFTQIILSITILKIVITIAIVIMSIFFLIKLKKIEVEKVE